MDNSWEYCGHTALLAECLVGECSPGIYTPQPTTPEVSHLCGLYSWLLGRALSLLWGIRYTHIIYAHMYAFPCIYIPVLC